MPGVSVDHVVIAVTDFGATVERLGVAGLEDRFERVPKIDGVEGLRRLQIDATAVVSAC